MNEITMKADTYEDVKRLVIEIGILPLSSFIPEHPSLESLTVHEQWHTGLETDPWLWRDRLPGDGLAAYGRFFAKKPLLIDSELFPLIKNLLEDPYTVDERYSDGELSKAAVDVYHAIAGNEGIDVKALRSATDLKSKESKAEFDRALIDLQSKADIVIAGITERLNANGTKNGWNGTCYMTASHWLELHGIAKNELPTPEAKAQLRALLKEKYSEAAGKYLTKIFKL
ncbi:hypothetical protein A8709_12700 [Paenibacillus pectinilyticus]|uniref:Uncharacterized protein n=1 Tax=Paenibacillus pectinilyticus TaxID=512399 RepID=A0A1C1A549_9BACL|nr:hypothetical protein [Paenibacillus pectinilyticus]OCT15693.1 hypothetical protein A8709_12700 [Paenibacillus pectinilyticus]